MLIDSNVTKKIEIAKEKFFSSSIDDSTAPTNDERRGMSANRYSNLCGVGTWEAF